MSAAAILNKYSLKKMIDQKIQNNNLSYSFEMKEVSELCVTYSFKHCDLVQLQGFFNGLDSPSEL